MGSTDRAALVHSMEGHALGRIGLHVAPEGHPCGQGMHLHLSPLVLGADGHLDFGVLGVFLDMACSQAGIDRHFVHADIAIHRVARPRGERIWATSTMLRSGGRSAVVQVDLHDDERNLVAASTQQVVFMGPAAPAVPPSTAGPGAATSGGDDGAWAQRDDFRARLLAALNGTCRLDVPLREAIGLIHVPGVEHPVLEMPLGPISRNGFGGLHGGVAFSLVAEAAADSATAVVGAVEVKSALLRYLVPADVGPIRATSTVMAQDDGSVHVRVEVVDLGRDGELCILGEVHAAAR